MIQELEDTLGGAGGLLEIPPKAGQRRDRPGDGHGVQQKGHQGPGGQRPGEDQAAPLPQDHDDGPERGEGHGASKTRSGHSTPETFVPGAIHLGLIRLRLVSLTSEALHSADLGEDLLRPGDGVGQAILDVRAHVPDPATEVPAHQSGEGDRRERHESESWIGDRDEHQGADQEDALPDDLGDAEAKNALDETRVRRQARCELTHASGGEEARRLVDEGAEQVPSQVRDDPLGDRGGQVALAEIDHRLHPEEP